MEKKIKIISLVFFLVLLSFSVSAQVCQTSSDCAQAHICYNRECTLFVSTLPGCDGQAGRGDAKLCLERDIHSIEEPIQEFLKPLEVEGQTYANIYGDKKLGLAGALDTDVQAEALVGEAKGYLEIAQVKRNYEFIFVPSEEKEESTTDTDDKTKPEDLAKLEFITGEASWIDPETKAKAKYFHVDVDPQYFDVYAVSAKTATKNSAAKVNTIGQQTNSVAAINGGFFRVSKETSKGNKPMHGLLIEEGVTIQEEYTDGDWPGHLEGGKDVYPSYAFVANKDGTYEIKPVSEVGEVNSARQSALLIKNHKAITAATCEQGTGNDFCGSGRKRARTVICIKDNGNVGLYVFEDAAMYEMAQFLQVECKDALNMDGGGSSSIYYNVPEKGFHFETVASSDEGSGVNGRSVPDAIVVKLKEGVSFVPKVKPVVDDTPGQTIITGGSLGSGDGWYISGTAINAHPSDNKLVYPSNTLKSTSTSKAKEITLGYLKEKQCKTGTSNYQCGVPTSSGKCTCTAGMGFATSTQRKVIKGVLNSPPSFVPSGSPSFSYGEVRMTGYYVPNEETYTSICGGLSPLDCYNKDGGVTWAKLKKKVNMQGTLKYGGRYYGHSNVYSSPNSEGKLFKGSGSDNPGGSAGIVVEDRTIAVTSNPEAPGYIPYGSWVYIKFSEGNPRNGWYLATDTGGHFICCPKIDVYSGEGQAGKTKAYSTPSKAEVWVYPPLSGTAPQQIISNKITSGCSDNKIALLGDSITVGWGPKFISSCNNQPKSYAVSGKKTSWMLGKIDEIKNSGKTTLIVLGGTNDITAGYEIDTIQQNLKNIYDSSKSAGMKVIAATIPPYTKYSKDWELRNNKAIVVNEWIRNQKGMGVDEVIDFYELLADGQVYPCMKSGLGEGTCNNVHPTYKGYKLMADHVRENYFDVSGSSITGAAGSFRFVVFSDLHNKYNKADALVQQIKQLNPDFVIDNGDSINANYDVNKGWSNYVNRILIPITDAGIPVFHSTGNHDVESNSNFEAILDNLWEKFYSEHPELYSKFENFDYEDFPEQSFTYRGNKFILSRITSHNDANNGMIDFIEEEIESNSFIFGHGNLVAPAPLINRNGRGSNYNSRSDLLSLLTQTNSYYISGHMHVFYPFVFKENDYNAKMVFVGPMGDYNGFINNAGIKIYQPNTISVFDVAEGVTINGMVRNGNNFRQFTNEDAQKYFPEQNMLNYDIETLPLGVKIA